MRNNKRPYKNAQTAALATAILSAKYLNDAAEFRHNRVSKEGFDGDFTGTGQAFAGTMSCRCASAEGIEWKEIDEVIQYDVLSATKVVDEKITEDTQENVINESEAETELSSKTQEVADITEETVLDGQDEDIDEQVKKALDDGADMSDDGLEALKSAIEEELGNDDEVADPNEEVKDSPAE